MSSVDREHQPLTQAPERIRILGAPSLYLQGPGALEDLGRVCRRMRQKAMVVTDGTVWHAAGLSAIRLSPLPTAPFGPDPMGIGSGRRGRPAPG
jgi:hypothetical protein